MDAHKDPDPDPKFQNRIRGSGSGSEKNRPGSATLDPGAQQWRPKLPKCFLNKRPKKAFQQKTL